MNRSSSRRTFVLVLLLATAAGCAGENGAQDRAVPSSPGSEAPPVRGTLRLTAFGSGGAEAGRHRHAWVNGTSWRGMEDNDLRGFPDGVFKYAWNQPGQVHVRIGRRDQGPRYGEYELFRVAQRWDGVRLPPEARVSQAALTLELEETPAFPVRLMLYEIKKEWNPGTGGTLGDNVSPPKPGEAWWGDAAFGTTSWALPGAGFASDDSPDADTGAMPLADATVEAGATAVSLSGPLLAAYVERRARAGSALLFLLKLSDAYEDTRGTVVTVYSGNHGDSRNSARRPRLEVEWEAPAVRHFELPVALERDRVLVLPPFETPDARGFAASFDAAAGYLTPKIEIRETAGDAPSEWVGAGAWVEAAWDRLECRVVAAEEPILLGDAFEASIHDTWVRTAPPEEQVVPWIFVSPSGERHEQLAQYAGSNRWNIGFEPDEPGPWRYSWTANFDGPFQSAEGTFDVLIADRDGALRALEAFLAELERVPRTTDDPEILERRMAKFMRLEHAALLAERPAPVGPSEPMRQLLRRIRFALSGEEVPDPIPMQPDKPPKWANGSQRSP